MAPPSCGFPQQPTVSKPLALNQTSKVSYSMSPIDENQKSCTVTGFNLTLPSSGSPQQRILYCSQGFKDCTFITSNANNGSADSTDTGFPSPTASSFASLIPSPAIPTFGLQPGSGSAFPGGGAATIIPASETDVSNDNSKSTSSSVPLGAVIGGAVGGVIFLIGLVAMFMFIRRRRQAGRGRDRYVVQLKSDPDFADSEEKEYVTNNENNRSSPLPRPLPLSMSTTSPLASASAAAAVPEMRINVTEQQMRGEGYMYQQPQETRSQSPVPPAPLHRAMSPTGSGHVAVSPIEYTPRSTYTSSSPSPTEPPPGPLAPPRPIQVDSEPQDAYIDLIPVEDTPQITHATLPASRSSRDEGPGGMRPISSSHDEELGEDNNKLHEQQGLLRSTSPGGPSKVEADEKDEEEDDDDEEIKYL
ncbi:hypothetical protein BGX28_003553 [Mortierella sp. GBA30]|nr:hypothetical protein BGX28_003553 [Mortierella sp. GBA30]